MRTRIRGGGTPSVENGAARGRRDPRELLDKPRDNSNALTYAQRAALEAIANAPTKPWASVEPAFVEELWDQVLERQVDLYQMAEDFLEKAYGKAGKDPEDMLEHLNEQCIALTTVFGKPAPGQPYSAQLDADRAKQIAALGIAMHSLLFVFASDVQAFDEKRESIWNHES